MNVQPIPTTFEMSGQSLTVGDCAEGAIAKYVHRIASFEKSVLQDQELEPLHKMRVAMRRLRSVLHVLEPTIVLPKACSRKAIGNIAEVLGKVRDLDVIQQTLKNSISPELPAPELQLLSTVSTQLSHRRRKAFKKLQSCLVREYREFEIAVHMWLQQPTYSNLAIANQLMSTVLPDLLLPSLARFFLHEGWTIGEEEIDDCQLILHDLRKSTKHIRYQTEFFLPFLQADTTAFLPLLEKTQELLGQMQDGLVLREIMVDTLGKKACKNLPEFSNQITERNLQAWREWQPVRSQLCSPDWRRSLRLACL